MNSTIHERPGVYSSYDASSVVSARASAKTIGAAAVATKGEANKVQLITSYEEGKSVFGEDASGVYGMSALLKVLFQNGAGAVKAVAVGEDSNGTVDYASAFAALNEEEDVGIVVCDSAETSVHQSLKTSVENASAARRERIAVVGGAELAGINGVSKRLNDNEIDQLVRGGVTPIECVGGVCSPVRGITTKTSSGGAADTTWRELTTILIVDEVIPTIRNALRTRFARSKNTAQSRGAIRSQVVLELEEMKTREIMDSYGEVKVTALESDPTVCLVEFSFTVVHGLNRIYLTAHITV